MVKSIRFKIILWYMLILTVTLSIFSLLLYHNLSQKLYHDVDETLLLKAEGIAHSIDTYWETERLEAIKDGITTGVFTKINNANFLKIAKRWVEEKSNDPALLNIVVQIFDSNGALIASSQKIADINIIPEHAVSKDQSNFRNTVVNISDEKPLHLRVFTRPVIENGEVTYIVQVATLLTAIESAAENLKFILFVLLPAIILATGVAGVLLAKIALNPVENMINTIHQITAENLKLRVTMPDTKDEIRRLADTFNEMLAKIDGAFTTQRQFIEDLTHELKTPLSALKGELEVALKKIRSKEEYETVLHSNLEEVNRIIRIVEDLLLLVSFENKAVTFDMKPLDISSLLRYVTEGLKVMASQKNIEVAFSSQDQIMIYADKDKLKRLFLNILDNAIKYTPANGKVWIEVSRENNYARIAIGDTGVGIPEEEIPHIFDRFYRVDKSRSEGGFGLGLSIAKSIAEAHHGKIIVESRLHESSIFTIFLPLLS